jgi:hypothetical protein
MTACRSAWSLAAGAMMALVASPAFADVGDWQSNYEPEPSSRRDGLTIGAHFGAALGNAAGYPNEVAKLGRPEFEANTGFGAGAGGALWLGLSPRDFFTFGVGLNQLHLAGDGYESVGTAVMVHIEVFPAFYQGRFFEDLGVFIEAGAGPRSITSGGEEAAYGGFMSFIGAGAFWEGLRLGEHFSAGPVLQYTHQFSLTLDSHIALVGARFTYGSGPG